MKEKKLRKEWMPESVFHRIWDCYHVSRSQMLWQQLVQGYLPFVEHVLRQNATGCPQGMDWDDIYQYGVVGLLEALNRYDPCQNPNFTAYASKRIQGAVYDGLMKFRGIRRSSLRKRRLMRSCAEQVQHELMRCPTHEELMQRLGMEARTYYESLNEAAELDVVSLESLDYKDILLRDEAAERQPDRNVSEDMTRQVLREAVGKLTVMEQCIIRMHYFDGLSLREIGRRTGYSGSWISRNHAVALEKLQSMKIRDRLEK